MCVEIEINCYLWLISRGTKIITIDDTLSATIEFCVSSLRFWLRHHEKILLLLVLHLKSVLCEKYERNSGTLSAFRLMQLHDSSDSEG